MNSNDYNNSAACIGFSMLLVLFSSFVIASGAMMLGLMPGRWAFPAAFAIGIVACFRHPSGKGWRLGGTVAAIVVCSIIVARLIYDSSYDGFFYHQETIAALADGWNPFYDVISGSKTNFTPWTIHYAKGVEIMEAVIVAFTSNIETGKAVNLIIFCACAFICYDVISLLAISAGKRFRRASRILLTLAVTASPIVCAQIFTYYIDLYKYFYLLLTLCGLYYLYSDCERHGQSILLMTIVLAIATKFNIFFEEGVWIILAIFYALWQKRSDIALRLIGIGAAALLIGLILCVHPYATNYMLAGNPLYPLLGSDTIDIMTGNTPEIYAGRNRFINFFISLFSFGKITADGRHGGFGFLMPIIIVMSIIIIILKRKRISSAYLYITFWGIISCFFFEQSWWARYICQLWIVGAIGLLIAALYYSQRWIAWIIGGMMLVSSASAAYPAAKSVYTTIGFRFALFNAVGEDTVEVVGADHPQVVRMLSDGRVKYKAIDSLPDNYNGKAFWIYLPPYPIVVLNDEQMEKLDKNCRRLHLHPWHRVYDFSRSGGPADTPDRSWNKRPEKAEDGKDNTF